MAAVVAKGQLTATPITNPFGLAGAAGVAADILAQVDAFLARGQPGGGTGLLAAQDFYGIAPGDPRFKPTSLPPATAL
jgi:hypothetical protein